MPLDKHALVNKASLFLPLFVFLSLFILATFLSQSACAGDLKGSLKIPEEGNIQKITLKDGSIIMGRITEIGESKITFETSAGVMEIAIDRIESIEEMSQSRMKDGKYWFPNPNKTRLYLSQTARMLPRGNGYILDIYAFFPSVAFGLTDFFSLGGGFSLIPGLNMDEQLFYFTPKLGFRVSDNLAFAGSMLIIRIPDPDDDDDDEAPTIGTLSGVMTFGSDDLSGTLGLGFGYVDDEIADKPAVLVGWEWRFSRRLSFVSENWIFPEIDEPLISYGIRFFGESIAADLALFNILDEDAIFPGIPYIDFVWNF
jgi:hypothetical protein